MYGRASPICAVRRRLAYSDPRHGVGRRDHDRLPATRFVGSDRKTPGWVESPFRIAPGEECRGLCPDGRFRSLLTSAPDPDARLRLDRHRAARMDLERLYEDVAPIDFAPLRLTHHLDHGTATPYPRSQPSFAVRLPVRAPAPRVLPTSGSWRRVRQPRRSRSASPEAQHGSATSRRSSAASRERDFAHDPRDTRVTRHRESGARPVQTSRRAPERPGRHPRTRSDRRGSGGPPGTRRRVPVFATDSNDGRLSQSPPHDRPRRSRAVARTSFGG